MMKKLYIGICLFAVAAIWFVCTVPVDAVAETADVTCSEYSFNNPVSTVDPYISQFYNSEKPHEGLDMTGESSRVIENEPISAAKAGRVVYADWQTYVIDKKDKTKVKLVPLKEGNKAGWGNVVMIDHGDGTLTVYGHLAENSISVKVGDWVGGGVTIGRADDTGHSDGSHLHFEIREYSGSID